MAQPVSEGPDGFATMMFTVLSYSVYSAAVRLGVPDELAGGPRSAADLAAAAGAPLDRMRRLLRAMAALRLLDHSGEDAFELTPAGRALAKNSDNSAKGMALFFGHPLTTRVFGELAAAVRGDVSAFQHVTGKRFFEYFGDDPDYAGAYHQAMRTGARMMSPFLREAFPWDEAGRIVDVGGGDGTTLTEILAANPAAHGTVYDTEQAVVDTAERIAAAGVGDRCGVEVGDFRDKVPAGADTYLVKNVLHEWDDAACVAILGNCRAAMAGGGRVVVAAPLLPDPADAAARQDPAAALYASISDIQLLCLSGRERTLAEYTALLERAGLRVASVRRLPYVGYYQLIEAVEAVEAGAA